MNSQRIPDADRVFTIVNSAGGGKFVQREPGEEIFRKYSSRARFS